MGITVQVHPDRYEVKLFPDEGNGAFAVVRAFEGGAAATLFLPSPAACDELMKAAAEAKRLLTGEPQPDWCPGVLTDDDGDTFFYCDRERGHAGSHHAPGPDEGSEIAWSDEPEDGGA